MSTASNDTVLVVDDDSGLCAMLKEYLQEEGFHCLVANSTDTMFKVLARHACRLVILDVMLPGENGLVALRRLREAEDPVPVIMLTARASDVERVLGFDLGADDYVSKPFNPQELVARARAILRRTEPNDQRMVPIVIDELEIRPGLRRVSVSGQRADLTSTEYGVLEALARLAGQVLSRDELYQQALSRHSGPQERSIDMHVASLRRKLGRWPDGSERIATVRGVGYVLTVFQRA